MMDQEKYREAVRNMRHSPASLERRGECWSEEDKEKLSEMFDDDVGITEMAVIFQRSETAIMQQIEKQDLYDRTLHPTRQRNNSVPYKCLCEVCVADPALCPLHKTCTNNQEET
ncbi:hypothetical protein [uncultured Dysosmobacter sp.]|uniref:hypothetical protein n=1 Tax=uncultured Dysosmobacter sp. TaxID=2591384 RepID=UPI002673703D|nr:hypothetical protein [uncultured Dysosmobacter sp.]